MHTNGVMNKRIAVVGLSAFLTYVISCLVPTTSKAPPQPPPAPVTVVNTTAQPVPVVQQGTPNVNVANSATSPVLVRSVDSGATQPLRLFGVITVPDSASATGEPIYTVPTGKRLVIEYISFEIVCPSDQQIAWADVIIGGATQQELPAPLQPIGPGIGEFTGGGVVKAYAEAGDIIQADVSRSLLTGGIPPGAVTSHVTVSGYLVNVP